MRRRFVSFDPKTRKRGPDVRELHRRLTGAARVRRWRERRHVIECRWIEHVETTALAGALENANGN